MEASSLRRSVVMDSIAEDEAERRRSSGYAIDLPAAATAAATSEDKDNIRRNHSLISLDNEEEETEETGGDQLHSMLRTSMTISSRSDPLPDISYATPPNQLLRGASMPSELFASTGHSLGVPKPHKGLGGRTTSTKARLRRQGFESLRPEVSGNFVVKSIRRGTQEWRTLIKPFVADLAFQSLVQPRYYATPRFQVYHCHAAVLFIDLSGYSKITTALAQHGAHTISNEVNAYLSRLLQIVHGCGGDVVKFAGDAVLVVWEGPSEDLEINVLAAAVCAMEMQKRAGKHIIPHHNHHHNDPSSDPTTATKNLCFRIHCGLACGVLESEVFQAKDSTTHMQKLYHSVGGDPIDEIGELVELAGPGQVCVSRDCLDYLDSYADCIDCDDLLTDGRILQKLRLNTNMLADIDDHVMKVLTARLSRRNSEIEEDFIHPSVLKLLSHGGLSPTQIAQMRNLCVLFIAMVANGSSVNWLTEVQAILDRHRCPIVQIIDDDKGVHLVTAINLYEAIPEAVLLGLDVCQELHERQVGCAIGMAMGSTFCGVTGSSTVACRWDLTGQPVVRAARLMQYAIVEGHEFVLDHSVYKNQMASSRLTLLHKGIRIKGTEGECPIYTLSANRQSSALRILESLHGSVHDEQVRTIRDLIARGSSPKKTILVTGPQQSGKKVVCQRAAGYAGLIPFLHVSSESAGQLQLARTIATWFSYVDDSDIQTGAADVLEHLDAQRWSRAHDTCIELLNLGVMLGQKACFVVDRVQFLDEFSLSLIRECLHVRKNKHGRELHRDWSGRVTDPSDHDAEGDVEGVVCFLCTHVSLYQWPCASELVNRLSRSGSGRRSVPTITIGRVPAEDLRLLFRDLGDMEVDDRWLDTYAESSGYLPGYFVERAAACRTLSGKLWSEGKQGLAITNQDMKLHIPHGMIKQNKELTVHQVSPEVAMKFTQLFDELPPLFQTFLKVLTMASKGGSFPVPRTTMWEVLNDLIDEGVEQSLFETVVQEMSDMFIITFDQGCTGEEAVSLLNPALADIAFDVCTPEQIDTICMALLDRMESMVDTLPSVPFVMSSFHSRLGKNEHIMIHLWRKGYNMMKQYMMDSDTPRDFKMNMLLETIDEEIKECGFNTKEVLGDDFGYPQTSDTSVGSNLPLCKVYMGPLTFGPMGQTLNVLTRNVFHEMKIFRGWPEPKKQRLLRSSAAAAERYCKEARIIEDFLSSYNLAADESHLKEEFQIVTEIGRPAGSSDEVQTKATKVLQTLIPNFVQHRRDRLLLMCRKVLESTNIPAVIQDADPVLRRAFKVLHKGLCSSDAVHDALMILAVNHWKPKQVKEQVPIIHRQTVARIRNRVIRRFSDAELALHRHQQGPNDLLAFFLVTALLHKAGEAEAWYL